MTSQRSALFHFAIALAAIGAVTAAYLRVLHVSNSTIVALSYLLVVLVVAAWSRFWVAIATSCVAMALFNFFFLPPVGTWTIADPENWVALAGFLIVSLVGSRLSAAARDREELAVERTRHELKSTLLNSIAHDLRTPLTAIRVAASNLQGSWLTAGERREQGDVVLTEVERLNRLFENILEMARIDSGAIRPEEHWVHPSEIVEAARLLVEHDIRERAIDLHIASDALVRLDPRLTASALAHLLENAAQYSPPGSSITVRCDLSPGEIAIAVRDKGQGVSSEDLPRLFDRFYRGTHAKKHAGTGMGLSIAAGLLVAEHGRLRVRNSPDGGAEFTITVPVQIRAAEAAEVSA